MSSTDYILADRVIDLLERILADLKLQAVYTILQSVIKSIQDMLAITIPGLGSCVKKDDAINVVNQSQLPAIFKTTFKRRILRL